MKPTKAQKELLKEFGLNLINRVQDHLFEKMDQYSEEQEVDPYLTTLFFQLGKETLTASFKNGSMRMDIPNPTALFVAPYNSWLSTIPTIRRQVVKMFVKHQGGIEGLLKKGLQNDQQLLLGYDNDGVPVTYGLKDGECTLLTEEHLEAIISVK